jgi:LytR cell envelope-related transcriptional attenuator
MHIVQEIGSYAGLAAVVGLAVLSALYFSQARDVRRLREWAGRAPERSEQVAQAAPARPGTGAVRPAPRPAAAPGAAAPKPAAAPGAPAPAATPAAAAAARVRTPAAAAAGTRAAPPGEQTGGDGAEESPEPPGNGTEDAGAPPSEKAPPQGPGVPAGGDKVPAAAPKPGPAVPASSGAARIPARPAAGLPSRPPAGGNTGPGQTAILSPPGQAEPWYRRLISHPRYLVLAIAGVLIVGGAAAFGVVQLTSKNDSGGGGGASQTAVGSTKSNGKSKSSGQNNTPAIDPSSITVSVLNGTTVPGLAARIGDQIVAKGFKLGNVTNAASQGVRNESVVLFTRGAERDAIAVSKALRIPQREPIDPRSQALGGDAGIVVVTGADLTP